MAIRLYKNCDRCGPTLLSPTLEQQFESSSLLSEADQLSELLTWQGQSEGLR